MKNFLRLHLLSLLLFMSAGIFQSNIYAQTQVANYSNDFTLNPSSSQWKYYWNKPDGWVAGSNSGNLATGAIGTTSSYTAMISTGSMLTADGDGGGNNSSPDNYVRLSSTGGHPGASGTSNSLDRYAISAYTISSAGNYSISNSSLGLASGNSNGIVVYVHVNSNSPVINQSYSTGTHNIDVSLGTLSANDVVYVCIGANGSHNSDTYTLDFDITIPTPPNSGVFYSTLYAKTDTYARLEDHGDEASQVFLSDVTGDNLDDAIAYFSDGDVWVAKGDGELFGTPYEALTHSGSTSRIALTGDVDGDGREDMCYFDPSVGKWDIALSNGSTFDTPTQWKTGNGVGSARQFLADVNGDGKDDAVIYFGTGGFNGRWYVGFSTGSGFGGFSKKISSHGEETDLQMMGDIDGDGKADAIYAVASTGDWHVALSDGSNFVDDGKWRSGFGISAQSYQLYDVDKDDKVDAVYVEDDYDWWVAYSLADSLHYNQRWIKGLQLPTAKGGLPAPDFLLLGSLDSISGYACAVSKGKWLCMNNTTKNTTAQMEQIDTWENWGNDYITDLTDTYGVYDTYDAGDTIVIDHQIQMIHDAGFTYITFDITNCSHAWVDDRAKTVIDRIVKWNDDLQTGEHKIFFNIALGCTRRADDNENAFFNALEDGCERAWTEFYLPNSASYYKLDGKPLVIHMITTGLSYIDNIDTWSGGSRTYIDTLTNRWMVGNQDGATINDPNKYGWIIPDNAGNPFHQEMMPIMPGFKNGSGSYVDREDGDFYKSHWLRVLENEPSSIWLNSFNETWEHTSVEPAYIPDTYHNDSDSITYWKDENGNRMDDYYWVMTKQYNRLYMYDELFINSYIKEKSESSIYKVSLTGFDYQSSMPSQAPVLLVPDGFRTNFSGSIIDSSLTALKSAQKKHDFISTRTEDSRMIIYPNPSNGNFSLSCSIEGAYDYSITDLRGTVIKNGTFNSSVNGVHRFNIEGQGTGIYLMKVKSENNYKVFKIVVE